MGKSCLAGQSNGDLDSAENAARRPTDRKKKKPGMAVDEEP